MEETKPKLLLVAEDDPLSQKLVKFAANSAGLRVLVVDGVKPLIKSFDSKPDAVLVDLHLPDMEVEDMLMTLREKCKLQKNPIKIILMTSGISPELQELAKKYGFESIIEKPITDEKLIAVFGIEKPVSSESSEPEAEQIQYQDKDSIIDLSFYIKGVGDDPRLLKESLNKVEKSWDSYLEKIEKAIYSDDSKQLHYWAHTIKGSLGFIKATDGVALAKTICEEAKAGHVKETVEPVRKLKEYIKKVYEEVDKVKEKIKPPTSSS